MQGHDIGYQVHCFRSDSCAAATEVWDCCAGMPTYGMLGNKFERLGGTHLQDKLPKHPLVERQCQIHTTHSLWDVPEVRPECPASTSIASSRTISTMR